MEIKTLISAEDIAARVQALGKEITEHFQDKLDPNNPDDKLIIIGVLKGAYIFTADLVRHIGLPQQVEFVRISSYGDSTESSGVLQTPDLALPIDIRDKNIIIVEDIVDTGQTAEFLLKYIRQQFQPKELKLVSFLSKPARRTVDINPDLYGFEIEDKFVVGYGLDYAERYRELKYLGYIDNVEE